MSAGDIIAIPHPSGQKEVLRCTGLYTNARDRQIVPRIGPKQYRDDISAILDWTLHLQIFVIFVASETRKKANS